MQPETVRIVAPVVEGNPNGYIVINKADLTPDMELFVEPAPLPADVAQTKAPPKTGNK